MDEKTITISKLHKILAQQTETGHPPRGLTYITIRRKARKERGLTLANNGERPYSVKVEDFERFLHGYNLQRGTSYEI